jgi:hypothetical protein
MAVPRETQGRQFEGRRALGKPPHRERNQASSHFFFVSEEQESDSISSWGNQSIVFQHQLLHRLAGQSARPSVLLSAKGRTRATRRSSQRQRLARRVPSERIGTIHEDRISEEPKGQ